MPLYEYACDACRREFELLIRGAETPACPDCGSTQIQRQLSVPAAHIARDGSLPICNTPPRHAPPTGGCGAPWCGQGSCGE